MDAKVRHVGSVVCLVVLVARASTIVDRTTPRDLHEPPMGVVVVGDGFTRDRRDVIAGGNWALATINDNDGCRGISFTTLPSVGE